MSRLRGLGSWLERRLKIVLHAVVRWLFGLTPKPLPTSLGAAKVVVLRFDRRLGNQVMLTPLFEGIRARLPRASITWVGPARLAGLVAARPEVAEARRLRPWSLLGRDGPPATLLWLRRQHFDVCVDASNPTHPSLSHALMARFCGARHVIGSAAGGFGALRSTPIAVVEKTAHEIELRLQLLTPLGAGPARGRPQLEAPSLFDTSDVHGFVAALEGQPFVLLNVGARLVGKQLDASTLAAIAQTIAAEGLLPVVLWGAQERALAERVVRACPAAWLAPSTQLDELAFLMGRAEGIVTCDTGPMHLSVGLGRPTCALFVSTPLWRYGYCDGPHRAVETRHVASDVWLAQVTSFVAQLARGAQAATGARHRREPPPGLTIWPAAPKTAGQRAPI